jgi:hypothetical protein
MSCNVIIFDPLNETQTSAMKLTNELYQAVHKIAKSRMWGKGVYCEVGIRHNIDGQWINRLDPRDEAEDSDLQDTPRLADYKGCDLPEVGGRLLLDLWVHNSDEFCGNVMVEIDREGIGAAYDPAYSDDNRFYTRSGYTPHSEAHIPKQDSRINW